MKKTLMQITGLAGSLTATSAMAHGDHRVMTPEHGLEHVLYYGLGFVALLVVIDLGIKVRKARKNK